ncbi:Dehydroquinate synthase-like protein [Nadsonia fulvescens var. elongata DSM 6958]|uniref:hydroxyacid-oxoacid transhydrogenase n=1 Tax=Nadsonia fulvescens var. elongata DSM 6958 TaxID=857566 RepID=A0A1E3PLT9_9ASCO|nr:Dehydroquinate synthase-like protein [Nadsonia fulvescens var. elongata DSM 6958]
MSPLPIAARLLAHIQSHPTACPCHGCSNPTSFSPQSLRSLSAAFPIKGNLPDYAFQMAASNIRYGPGVTREVGMDFANMGITQASQSRPVAVFTDKVCSRLSPALTMAVESLEASGVPYVIYDNVRVEPSSNSVRNAVSWAREINPSAYLAVGGGSVMDTAKVANLLHSHPECDLMDFVAAPLGKGQPIARQLLPLIAVPTTAGTGSETTGTAIFDLIIPEKNIKAKTGIAHRNLKPTLGLVDPENTATMPAAVVASSGLDVLCHSLESFTAIPYNMRYPRPNNPLFRPAYQGSNPISDVFSLEALRMAVKYLPRAVADATDKVARENMLLAATLAGVGFGNAGVHLCHGLSYAISGLNKTYKHNGYEVDHNIVPHGVSVAITAPSVFKYTASSNPERHLQCAAAFGIDTSNVKRESAGEVLSEALKDFLYVKLGKEAQPRGISHLGYTKADLNNLVLGALPQTRVLTLAPGINIMDNQQVGEELHTILEDSMKY